MQFGTLSLNPQTPDSRIVGFIDANGNYRKTLFYDIYKDGGVFVADEMDNSSPSLLTTFNSAIENGFMAFPCGLVRRSPNFVFIGTGNTSGRGASPMFPERRPFDAATADRFTYIHWDYDTKLEKAVTLSHNPKASLWFEWIQAVRKFTSANHPRVLVSPRASYKGATYLLSSQWSLEDIADATVFRGVDKDTRKTILDSCPLLPQLEECRG
jgi:hypothetical protein